MVQRERGGTWIGRALRRVGDRCGRCGEVRVLEGGREGRGGRVLGVPWVSIRCGRRKVIGAKSDLWNWIGRLGDGCGRCGGVGGQGKGSMAQGLRAGMG